MTLLGYASGGHGFREPTGIIAAWAIHARCLPTDARRSLDSPETPAEAAECLYLLLPIVAQDVAHAGEGPYLPGLVNVPPRAYAISLFWVITEVGMPRSEGQIALLGWTITSRDACRDESHCHRKTPPVTCVRCLVVNERARGDGK